MKRTKRLPQQLVHISVFAACFIVNGITVHGFTNLQPFAAIGFDRRIAHHVHSRYGPQTSLLARPISSSLHTINDSIDETMSNSLDTTHSVANNLELQSSDNTVNVTALTSNAMNETKALTDQQSTSVIPSYKQLLLFLSTTVLIWLSEPVLSLVDATVIGSLKRKSAIIQLAAIGPATTLYDSLLYLTYFLAIATTNKLTKANAGTNKDYRHLQTITSHVLGVAAILGGLTTFFCYACGPMLLHKMVVGQGAAVAATQSQQLLLHHATRYTAIRASVSIASIMGMVMQSFCLATLDTKTPIIAVAAASVVNVVGDLILRPWGVQGAAMATAAASVLSASILYGAVKTRMDEWRRLEQKTAETPIVNGGASTEEGSVALTRATINGTGEGSVVLPTRNITSSDESILGHPSRENFPAPVPIMSIPDQKSLIELIKLSGPIFFVILAKIACYGAMTLRATDFGVIPLAAHNLMMRIFFFYGTFGDAISQTAQTYLPATLYPKPNKTNFNRILRRLFTIASILSVINSQACTLILKHCGSFLVSDPNIILLMSRNTGFVGLALMFHPFIMFLEGTVIASRDFRSLIMTYIATLGLHFTVLGFFCKSFPAIWRTFFLFQAIRAGIFSWNVWRRQREIQKQETLISSS